MHFGYLEAVRRSLVGSTLLILTRNLHSHDETSKGVRLNIAMSGFSLAVAVGGKVAEADLVLSLHSRPCEQHSRYMSGTSSRRP